MASKTTGQTIGTIGGALIGGAIGGPQGALVGASLGYSAGTMIDPPDNSAGDMPPMASYPVQRSNKGTPIAKVYGTVRVAGNILWMGENHPWQKKESAGGKGGGGSSTVTDSGNRRSFLIGICEGPVLVLRMWKGKEEISLSNATFFRGDGSADTGINALTGEEFSNYPNTACAFFNEFEIGTGGTLPNFTFEVMESTPSVKIGITSMAELALIGNDPAYPMHGDYELLVDLDATGITFWPIGLNAVTAVIDQFEGTFDGKFHTISNMTIDTDVTEAFVTRSSAGLFLSLDDATIENLTISNMTINGWRTNKNFNAGLLAASSVGNGTITNVHTQGTITAFRPLTVGGLCGQCNHILNIVSTDIIIISLSGSPRSARIGGIAGFAAAASISNVYAQGTIDISNSAGNDNIGGLIGQMGSAEQVMENCYSAVVIDAIIDGDIGGFIGEAADVTPDYTSCYWDNDLIETPPAPLDDIGDDGDTVGILKSNTSAMKQQATYVGYDFDTIWQINEGSSYPTLRWQGVSAFDQNPSVIIKDLLTNTRYGAGLDESTWIGTASFTAAENFCDANGLRFSFAIDRLRPVVDWIDFINSHFQGFFRMSEGKIQLHIYKEESSMFTITRDNLFIEKGEDPDPPVTVEKRLSSEIVNRVEITYTNRNATYDTSVAIAMDESDQRASGKVKKKTLQLTGITNAALAQKIAYRILFESLYRYSTYSFVLGYQDMLLEVGDVGTITDGFMLTDELIRITNIEEIKDGKQLSIQAVEDSAFIYEEFEFLTQDTERVPDSAPTLVDASATFTESITDGGFAVSIVPGGADTNGWQIYKSYDDISYDFVGNAYIDDPAASPTNSTGTTTSPLPAHKTGPVYAGKESLLVDIGTVTVLDTAVTDTQFFNNKRLCKIGDEVLAYKTCEQTAVEGVWRITGLIRGLFGTEAEAHIVGETFWTINTDFTFAFADADIGQTIYFKFLTLFGSSIQSLSDVTGISYEVRGNYKRPMPVSLMRIQDHEGDTTYETDDVVISFYLASKTAGFNLGGFGDILWNAYETDLSIQTLDVTLKEVDDTEILNEVFDISEIGEPMAVFIADADRDGKNPYIIEINPGALYSGIGSRELQLEQV